jgi:hypothetical protein
VFSNCREYTADSTLTFGPSPTLQAPSASENSHVQPGLQLQLALDKTLDANEAVVVDPIRPHVLQGDGDIPRGAHVYGRVSRIINFNDQMIQIEFEQIEYRRSRAHS